MDVLPNQDKNYVGRKLTRKATIHHYLFMTPADTCGEYEKKMLLNTLFRKF